MTAIAVIMRTKDRPLLLERAVQSICDQTFQDWHLIIVNDGGGTEAVNNVVKKFDFELRMRYTVINNPKSIGMEAASNLGIKSSSSEFLLIHDDDDSLNPLFLEKTILFLRSTSGNKFKAVATKITTVYEEIIETQVVEKNRRAWMPEVTSINLADMAVVNRIVPISFVYRREAHDEIGYYNEALPVLGDWEFYLRFLRQYDIHLLNEFLANYHHRLQVHTDIYSNSIYGSIDKHRHYDSYIRNQWLREDISSGNFGLGYLTNMPKLLASSYNQNKADLMLADEGRNSLIRQLKSNLVNEVTIYGAGEFTQLLLPMLDINKIFVNYIIDSKPELWGTSIREIQILSLDEAICKRCTNYVVGSFKFGLEIAQLINRSYENSDTAIRIFIP